MSDCGRELLWIPLMSSALSQAAAAEIQVEAQLPRIKLSKCTKS